MPECATVHAEGEDIYFTTPEGATGEITEHGATLLEGTVTMIPVEDESSNAFEPPVGVSKSKRVNDYFYYDKSQKPRATQPKPSKDKK